MDYAIEATGLTKRFGDTQALGGRRPGRPRGHRARRARAERRRQDDRRAHPRDLAAPDAGTARVAGLDVAARRRSGSAGLIGLTGQYASVDEDLTGTQNLVHDRPAARPAAPRDAQARAAELLEWFDLTDAAGRMAKTYSGGMRRRLDLAASLVGRPSVIFLDEPTTGLDPAKREDMWDVVRALVADGSTVLLTTQYLEEADALADEITVIDHGRVIAHDTPDGLKRDRRRPAAHGAPGRPGPGRTTSRAILAELTGARPEPPAAAQLTGRSTATRAAPSSSARLRARRHRASRALPPPAQPRRGLLDPHRPSLHEDRTDTEVAA